MRQALNENPMVQIAVLGIGGIVVAFLLFTSVLKKDEPAPEPTAAAATATADPAAAPPEAVPPAETGATVPSSNGELKATKGLPKDVLAAYSADKAVVLAVIDSKAEGSARFAAAARRQASGDVAVFVVDVNDIADYSRITEGVSVSRTPALVVVKPQRLSDGLPTASVSYDLIDPQGLRQAIGDAFYAGGNVPAYP